jgi:hypothetical protein
VPESKPAVAWHKMEVEEERNLAVSERGCTRRLWRDRWRVIAASNSNIYFRILYLFSLISVNHNQTNYVKTHGN